MKAANLAGAVLGTILKVVFVVVVIYLVYTGASTCYDYGYRIFTEPAVSAGEGRKITVTLTSDMSATEIGTVMQEGADALCRHLDAIVQSNEFHNK